MAYVLAVLASGRRRGFTAGLLAEAAEGAASVPGVEVEVVQLTRYRFDACTSCFHCIRDDAHRCSLRDDMGRGGEGALFQKVLRANGLILGDPVHGWGPSARAHVFFERLYPFTWSGELAGMPFASISCASNQGMHRLANQEICKWAFTKALRHVGGLPVHTAYYEEARAQARQLGEATGRAALADAAGRRPLTDEECYLSYLDRPWSVLEPYLDNLTDGTFQLESSLVRRSLAAGTFHNSEAVELLHSAEVELGAALAERGCGRREEAARRLVRASAYWTRATWLEFVEPRVVHASQPAAYRPLPGR